MFDNEIERNQRREIMFFSICLLKHFFFNVTFFKLWIHFIHLLFNDFDFICSLVAMAIRIVIFLFRNELLNDENNVQT